VYPQVDADPALGLDVLGRIAKPEARCSSRQIGSAGLSTTAPNH
jgi:hypothetical protein